MTSIKDKLASSVRQAKSTTPSKAAAPRAAAEDTKQTNTEDTKQTNIQAKPVRQTAAPARSQNTVANPEPASSAQVLFPDRVWPD